MEATIYGLGPGFRVIPKILGPLLAIVYIAAPKFLGVPEWDPEFWELPNFCASDAQVIVGLASTVPVKKSQTVV